MKARKLRYRNEDRIRGAQLFAKIGVTAGAVLWACESTVGLPNHKAFQALKSWLRTDATAIEDAMRKGKVMNACVNLAKTPPGTFALAAGAIGCSFFPVSRYWSETGSKGMRYEGTTARNTRPKTPRPPLMALETILQKPWTIPFRLLLLQWGRVDGTIAADTTHFAFGTRMHIPGYGWGIVEDRGGAIQGVERIDLFHRNHESAIQWGRKKVTAHVER